jgi:diphthamide synthase subunit DPH2
MLSLVQTDLVYGFCDESNKHSVSIMEFLVHCTHHVLKEDDVMELRIYARLCFVILLLGMHVCVCVC